MSTGDSRRSDGDDGEGGDKDGDGAREKCASLETDAGVSMA